MSKTGIECCNETHATRFCPDCGKQINPHSLRSLLNHLALQRKSMRLRIERFEKRNREQGQELSESKARLRDKIERTANKWEVWHDALAELIEDVEKSSG